jgi:hypothetical protein
MSLTAFLAFCILGCDFLLYFLFQWIYGEKRRERSRRIASRGGKGSIPPDVELRNHAPLTFRRGESN